MRLPLLVLCAGMCLGGLVSSSRSQITEPGLGKSGARSFTVRGIVQDLAPDDKTVVIRHEAVTNYMAAMTMPFKVKSAQALAGLQRGDRVTFQLHVTETESWVDGFARIGTVTLPAPEKPAAGSPAAGAVGLPDRAWLDYKFTNELGQAVSLGDFHGQALAVTFFYTRCPLPDYCPRLSRNFQVASQKLAALPGLPGNWHFLSISFDPQFDTPAQLKAYAQSYGYDPAHWSLLTASPDIIADVARRAGISYAPKDGVINHNFRTLIVDASGHLQTVFPTSGDLADSIVSEMVKAISPTNGPALGKN